MLTDIEYAGFLLLSECEREACNATKGNLFYWYIENSKKLKNAPIVLWLNGGPGSASTYGFFIENGLYIVNKDGKTLTKRDFSWSQKTNYLMIDQPAGVGLSYGKENAYRNESEAMDQLYFALKIFF